jgi:TolB-like protein
MEDLSPTPNPELQLGSALTSELTTTLQGIASIPRVISPRTARQFENSTADPIDIARELGVEGVVETSYQVIDDRIRVQASLIEASTGESIWAHSLQRDLDDLLALQGQLASTIAREIGAALDPREAEALAGGERIDPRAWLAYQEGLENASLGLDTRSLRAVESFREAIRIEPEWAEAHAHLALNCAWRWGFLGNEEERDLVVEGKQALVDAIRLDPNLAAVQTARAMQEFWFDFDLAAAKAALEQARELNPADASGLLQESVFWVFAGDFERGIEVGKRALELDPLNPTASRSLGWIYFTIKRYEEALAQHDVTREILARFPDDDEAELTDEQRTWNLIGLGRVDEAHRIVEANEDLSITLYDSCFFSLAQGDSAFVRNALRRPVWSGTWDRDWADNLQAWIGNPDPAFEAFERYYRDRNPRLWWQIVETIWPESFRADPRWTEWRRRLRLPV